MALGDLDGHNGLLDDYTPVFEFSYVTGHAERLVGAATETAEYGAVTPTTDPTERAPQYQSEANGPAMVTAWGDIAEQTPLDHDWIIVHRHQMLTGYPDDIVGTENHLALTVENQGFNFAHDKTSGVATIRTRYYYYDAVGGDFVAQAYDDVEIYDGTVIYSVIEYDAYKQNITQKTYAQIVVDGDITLLSSYDFDALDVLFNPDEVRSNTTRLGPVDSGSYGNAVALWIGTRYVEIPSEDEHHAKPRRRGSIQYGGKTKRRVLTNKRSLLTPEGKIKFVRK